VPLEFPAEHVDRPPGCRRCGVAAVLRTLVAAAAGVWLLATIAEQARAPGGSLPRLLLWLATVVVIAGAALWLAHAGSRWLGRQADRHGWGRHWWG
jgi:hypothetical protein